MRAGRIHRELIGNRPQRSQHPAAPHNNAGIRFLDHRQGHLLVQHIQHAGTAARLQIHQSMRQCNVVFPDELEITAHITGELRAIAPEIIGRRGPSRDRHIQEIRRPRHHTAPLPGPPGHHNPPPRQIPAVPRNNERQPHTLPRQRRSKSHNLPQLRPMLQIIKRGHRPNPPAQRRMGGNIGNPLPPKPNLGGVGL